MQKLCDRTAANRKTLVTKFYLCYCEACTAFQGSNCFLLPFVLGFVKLLPDMPTLNVTASSGPAHEIISAHETQIRIFAFGTL